MKPNLDAFVVFEEDKTVICVCVHERLCVYVRESLFHPNSCPNILGLFACVVLDSFEFTVTAVHQGLVVTSEDLRWNTTDGTITCLIFNLLR